MSEATVSETTEAIRSCRRFTEGCSILTPAGLPINYHATLLRAFADRVATILADPSLAARMGKAGHSDVALRFGEGRLVEETRALYRSLLPASSLRAL